VEASERRTDRCTTVHCVSLFISSEAVIITSSHFTYQKLGVWCDVGQRLEALTGVEELGSATAWAVSGQTLTTKARFNPRPVRAECVVGRVAPGEVFLPALQFYPVSIIPTLLHTHSSIYHPRCIMFFSQHFGFPCQRSEERRVGT
jgi:hypothetical protein